MIPQVLAERRALTEEKVRLLRSKLEETNAPQIVGNAACVYATGSVGRSEMSNRSDLDIFIVRDKSVALPLTNLDEIRLKARLIEVGRDLQFPDFSGDGEYLKSYDVKEDLLQKLGSREDDYSNVLTARLLLLLESRPILGDAVYNRAIEDLVGRYWRDYPQNSSDFLPVFLANDILRFWKTMCLNYEERTGDAHLGKRRLLNYKLKYSRLLTCYSAILYLTTELRVSGTVGPDAVRQMVALTPTARLEDVANRIDDAKKGVEAILCNYADKFLVTCDEEKKALQDRFTDSDFKRERFEEAKEFGDAVFRLLQVVGESTPLFRYLVA